MSTSPPDPINQSTLEAIETAQGTFCLDKSFPGEAGRNGTKFKYWDPHKTMLANRYLHGNGSQQHSCNRWFDSAIQVSQVFSYRIVRIISTVPVFIFEFVNEMGIYIFCVGYLEYMGMLVFDGYIPHNPNYNIGKM